MHWDAQDVVFGQGIEQKLWQAESFGAEQQSVTGLVEISA